MRIHIQLKKDKLSYRIGQVKHTRGSMEMNMMIKTILKMWLETGCLLTANGSKDDMMIALEELPNFTKFIHHISI